MVFNFDGVVADLPTIKREAWVALAQQLELPLQQQMLHHPELQVRVFVCVRLLVDAKCCFVTDSFAVDACKQHARFGVSRVTGHLVVMARPRKYSLSSMCVHRQDASSCAEYHLLNLCICILHLCARR